MWVGVGSDDRGRRRRCQLLGGGEHHLLEDGSSRLAPLVGIDDLLVRFERAHLRDGHARLAACGALPDRHTTAARSG